MLFQMVHTVQSLTKMGPDYFRTFVGLVFWAMSEEKQLGKQQTVSFSRNIGKTPMILLF